MTEPNLPGRHSPRTPWASGTLRQVHSAISHGTRSSIILIDPNYLIIFANNRAREGGKLAYGRPLAVGDCVLDYRRAGDEKTFGAFLENFQQATLTRNFVECEMYYPRLNAWLRSEYSPVYSTKDQLIGVLLNVHDVTERKRLEGLSVLKQSKLDKIAWSQSHETRQPLATLLGLINILDKESLNEENKTILQLLQTTALKLDEVIRKNVTLAKIPPDES